MILCNPSSKSPGLSFRTLRTLTRTICNDDKKAGENAPCFIELDYFWKEHKDSEEAIKTVRLNIRQIQLHLFDTGVAVFALKMQKPDDQNLRLCDVLQIQDIFRRIYSPFWNVEKEEPVATGFCPSGARIFNSSRKLLVNCNYRTEGKAQKGFVDENREPSLVNFWSWLISPIQPKKFQQDQMPWFQWGDNFLEFTQIHDERTPFMSRIAVADPRKIKQADWMRLVSVDRPGPSNQYPVSPGFPDESFLSYCYDRFWSSSDKEPSCRFEHSTRWLCSGYAFVGVGTTEIPPDEEGNEDYRPFINSYGRDHFRHHYFKLGLIAHFHRASLLAFERKLAEAVDALRDGMDNQFKRREFQLTVQEIEVELSRFRSQFWFTEVSNQIQAQELFDLWSEHLGTRKLFDEVFNEARDASQIVNQWNEQSQAESGQRLGLVALAFLIVSPLITILTSDVTGVLKQLSIGLPIAIGTILFVLVGGKRLSHIIDFMEDGQLSHLKLFILGPSYRTRTKLWNCIYFVGRVAFVAILLSLVIGIPLMIRCDATATVSQWFNHVYDWFEKLLI